MKVSQALKILNSTKDKNRYITPFYKVKTMIKINNVTYSDRKIVLPNFIEGDIIELTSTASNVTWELIKFPTNQENINAIFDMSDSNPSTLKSELLTLNLVGTYYINVRERDSNGNYSETKIYIRSNSILVNASLPFSGEKEEISSRGWGDELLEYVINLTGLIYPLLLIEIDGGTEIYNGNETLMNCGDVITSFGYTLDGGTADGIFSVIDGGNV
jgi:hypothetical protein